MENKETELPQSQKPPDKSSRASAMTNIKKGSKTKNHETFS